MSQITTGKPTDAVSFENMREDFVMCRLALHAWTEVLDDEVERPQEPGWWWLILQCERCETIRYDLIDSNNDVFRRRYKYPSGYQVDEKITRSQMRGEWAQRFHLDAINERRNNRKSNTNAKKNNS